MISRGKDFLVRGYPRRRSKVGRNRVRQKSDIQEATMIRIFLKIIQIQEKKKKKRTKKKRKKEGRERKKKEEGKR